jgi:hypothetical protein
MRRESQHARAVSIHRPEWFAPISQQNEARIEPDLSWAAAPSQGLARPQFWRRTTRRQRRTAFIFEFIQRLAKRSPPAGKLLTAPLRFVDQCGSRPPISAQHLKIGLRDAARRSRSRRSSRDRRCATHVRIRPSRVPPPAWESYAAKMTSMRRFRDATKFTKRRSQELDGCVT